MQHVPVATTCPRVITHIPIRPELKTGSPCSTFPIVCWQIFMNVFIEIIVRHNHSMNLKQGTREAGVFVTRKGFLVAGQSGSNSEFPLFPAPCSLSTKGPRKAVFIPAVLVKTCIFPPVSRQIAWAALITGIATNPGVFTASFKEYVLDLPSCRWDLRGHSSPVNTEHSRT